ncbi:methyl-CpG-binding domain protein 4-like protein [Abeliophyllum distichum]|uniref:Methyl-CpG-binding domain protein 4-like protein n=1 Tax=Abeliophyllum distichum TaxID=126358 RepID=A0ABD1QHM8_9LAMI
MFSSDVGHLNATKKKKKKKMKNKKQIPVANDNFRCSDSISSGEIWCVSPPPKEEHQNQKPNRKKIEPKRNNSYKVCTDDAAVIGDFLKKNNNYIKHCYDFHYDCAKGKNSENVNIDVSEKKKNKKGKRLENDRTVENLDGESITLADDKNESNIKDKKKRRKKVEDNKENKVDGKRSEKDRTFENLYGESITLADDKNEGNIKDKKKRREKVEDNKEKQS